MDLKRIAVQGISAGMNDGASVASQFRRGEVKLLRNVRPDFDGSAAVRGGARRLSASAIDAPGSSGYGQVWTFTTAAGVEQIVAAIDDALWYSTDGGSTFTSIVTGLTAGLWDADTMRVSNTNYLLLVNGTHGKSWSGSAVADITGLPSGSKYIRVFNDRAWVAGGAGNRAHASKISDFNTWSGNDGLSAPVGDATTITGLGICFDRLVVFKANQTALVDGFGDSSLVVASGARGASQSVGCIAFRTIVPAGDQGLCWQSQRGIEFFDGQRIVQLGKGASNFIGTFDTRLSTSALRSRGYFWAERNEYWLLAPVRATSVGAESLGAYGVAVNLTTGAVWRLDFGASDPTHKAILSITTATVPVTVDAVTETRVRPLAMDADGYTVTLEYGTQDFAADIPAQIDGPYLDFGEPARRKWVRISRAMISGPASSTADGSVVADESESAVTTFTITDTVPRAYVARVSARGVNVYSRWDLKGGQKITSMELEATIMFQGVR